MLGETSMDGPGRVAPVVPTAQLLRAGAVGSTTFVEDMNVMDKVVRVTVTKEAAAVDTWICVHVLKISSCYDAPLPAGEASPCPFAAAGGGAGGQPAAPARASKRAGKGQNMRGVLAAGDGDSGSGSGGGGGGKRGVIRLGMDVECRPNFVRCYSLNPAALLQLSLRHLCLIVELGPRAVAALGRLELSRAGLKTLAAEVLGKSMRCSKRVTVSDWFREALRPAQVQYAATDAWVSFALLERLGGGSEGGDGDTGAESAAAGKMLQVVAVRAVAKATLVRAADILATARAVTSSGGAGGG
eukprot:jgi/Mesen1/6964/ME000360S06233